MSIFTHTNVALIKKLPLLLSIFALALFVQSCAVKEYGSATAAKSTAVKSTAVKSMVVAMDGIAETRFAIPPQLNMKALEEECSGVVTQQELHQPQEISPNADGVLQTELVVRIKERCVPVYNGTTLKWEWTTLNLRTYGFPIDHAQPINPADPDDPNIAWSAPGPTFILDAGSAPGAADGSNFKMTLHNYMPTQEDYSACDPLVKGITPDTPPNPNYTSPNCFHGNNVTNFHFHGFHVSPQEHQDYVLLSLLPDGATAEGHTAAHSRGDTAVGNYSYDVARLRGNQAPGTHWYHAHKHGATALQVLNGLVGTFEVHGEFDTQLNAFYDNQLDERLMVVQQLQEQLPAIANSGPASILVNGQANPTVTMNPGEIQRWRFVGATMQASAQLNIGFEEEPGNPYPEIRQIAMDGVQFAPENYECQTLLRGPDCVNDDLIDLKEFDDFHLNPGNRIDVLIKAPNKPGIYHLTHEVVGNIKEGVELKDVMKRADVLAKAAGTEAPPLLTLVVREGISQNMSFPTTEEFPKMPGYLADLVVPADSNTDINYQMHDRGTANKVGFTINNKRYDPNCIDEGFTLNKAEKWTLTNNSNIAHPFHIHINPFQLISTKSYPGNSETITNYNPPYIWFDTYAIPIASTQGDKPNGEAVIHYEAIDFTGEFVNHCHILGHEDRGMMQNVQATCADGKWGVPSMTGGSECPGTVDTPPTCYNPSR